MTRRSSILLIPVLLVAMLTSCAHNTGTTGPKQTPLQIAAKAIDDASKGLAAVQTTIISANANKLISDATTSQILGVCKTINVILSQASAVVKAQSATPQGVLPLLQSILSQVNTDLAQNLLNIKDPKTLAEAQGIVATIQVGLAAAVIAVSGS